jgi:hypothetical protein
MLTAIRGTYDGKTFRVLPAEKLPIVTKEVPVAIVFLEPVADEQQRQMQLEAAQWMKAVRSQMLPLDTSIKEMIEEGRER